MTREEVEIVRRQLGRDPRGLRRVAARCPHGQPAVVEQAAYLDDGTPFPTTYYLTCPHAVARVSRLESGGAVGRYESLVRRDAAARRSYDAAFAQQRTLRRPAAGMADGGAALRLGIAGARAGSVKCLHAHVAFALAEPGYELGAAMAAEAGPLFPPDGCCSG